MLELVVLESRLFSHRLGGSPPTRAVSVQATLASRRPCAVLISLSVLHLLPRRACAARHSQRGARARRRETRGPPSPCAPAGSLRHSSDLAKKVSVRRPTARPTIRLHTQARKSVDVDIKEWSPAPRRSATQKRSRGQPETDSRSAFRRAARRLSP